MVTTTADDKLVKIRASIESIIKQLSEIIIDRDRGWEDFSLGYQDNLRNALNTFLDLRDEL